MRWVEISGTASRARYTVLQNFLKKAGKDNEVSFVETTVDKFHAELKSARENYDAILIGSPFTELAFDMKMDFPAAVLPIKAVDALIKDKEGRWWPQSLLNEAFIHSMAHHLKTLDLNATALVVGSGGAARAVLAALLRIGFNKFNITDRFEERGRLLISDLRRNFFNVRFDFVPQVALTSLPGIHSLLVNATPLTPENDLLKELQFFNFIKEGAAVVDLVPIPPRTPLLEEAEHVGAKTVNGVEVAAEIDRLWAQKVANVQLDLVALEKELTDALGKEPHHRGEP